jgi:hypothetical protein
MNSMITIILRLSDKEHADLLDLIIIFYFVCIYITVDIQKTLTFNINLICI